MSVLLNKNTKVLVQGITGRIGNFHAEEMIAYGTNVVAGVTPGKGGTCLLYTSPSPRDATLSRMPSSA